MTSALVISAPRLLRMVLLRFLTGDDAKNISRRIFARDGEMEEKKDLWDGGEFWQKGNGFLS